MPRTPDPLAAAPPSTAGEPDGCFQSFLYRVASPTLCLDADWTILFFSPATTSLLSIRPHDIGRSLADLNISGLGEDFFADAAYVLAHGDFLERSVIGPDLRSYRRCIANFNAPEFARPGISITFADDSQAQQLASDLHRTRHDADLSRTRHLDVLARLSHDLRQPLQTMKLLQALLAEALQDNPALRMAEQLGETLSDMSGMFNLLLDKASAASDAVIAHRVDFQLNSLLQAVGPALKHRASEQGARLRIVPCHERIHSDPALLKQLLSVLTDSALAHNEHGRLLIGCRRHDGWLRLEVRGRASGVTDRPVEPDLTDARRLSAVLGHQLHSCPGSRSGMVYAISIALDPAASAETLIESAPAAQPRAADHRGIIMIVEDDADLLKLLGGLLRGQGYAVALALNSAAALSWIYHSGLKPDLILADLHLGIDMNGLELIATLRSQWRVDLPAIVLTGDVSNATALAVAAAGCTQLNKPAKLKELIYLVHSMFAHSGLERAVRCESFATPSVIFVVDDDQVMRDTVRQILQADGYEVRDFATCEAFMRNYAAQERVCLLIEARLPDGEGVDVLRSLRQKGDLMPIIVISASNDIAVAVAAMRAGAWDFIEKPCDRREMLSSIERALGRSEQNHRTMAGRQGAIDYIATLTARQRQIMDMVLAGHPSKNIAAELGISQRTVENHRASIMTRTHSRSIPALARLALAATLQISTAV